MSQRQGKSSSSAAAAGNGASGGLEQQVAGEAEMERLYGHLGELQLENDVEGSESLSSEDESSEDDDDDDDDDEEDDDDENDVEGSEEETSWINWFCSLRENAFLCEVDEDYIEDDFNLTGLSSVVPYYDYALDVILDIETPNDQNLTQIQQEMIESAAEMLYGLIHARYILTTKGMAAMLEKYQNVDFGRCHRVYCQGQPVLPVGQSDVPRHTTVNVFCPKCRDIFFPKSQRAGRKFDSSRVLVGLIMPGCPHDYLTCMVLYALAEIDGAYFGTTFPHVFLMTHSQLVPPPPTQVYVPRVYGYKVHSSSEYYTGRKKIATSSSGRGGNGGNGRKPAQALKGGRPSETAQQAR